MSKKKIIGWKGIAERLGISVKTAMRWRPMMSFIRQSFQKCSVWCYQDEMDSWLEERRGNE